MLRGLVILLCFVSLILADNPLDILKDEFTIIRPFTVLENNATFYCKVTVLELLNSLVIRQSSGSHQAVNGQSLGSHYALIIFSTLVTFQSCLKKRALRFESLAFTKFVFLFCPEIKPKKKIVMF